jgi:hypothetical protein
MNMTAGAAVPRSIATHLSPSAKARLAGEILLAYVRVRRNLRRADFRSVLSTIRSVGGPERADTVGPARLGRAVARTLRVLPTDSRCLMQSLVLTSLLARRGIPSLVVIGVSPGADFGAHAWVESSGVPLLPPREHRFERLVEL